MKKLLALAMAFTMITLTACGNAGNADAPAAPAAEAQSSAPADAPEEAAEEPAADAAIKDTIVWAQGADVTSLDPQMGKETPAVAVTCNIFDTLVIKVDGVPSPCLAESWENVDDVTWDFKIRQDVKFHDGTPMTVEDVKFSLDRAINTPAVAYIVDFIEEVTIKDETTITITTKAPYAPILYNLAVPYAAVVPKAYVEANEEEFILNPIGTGAYKFVEWKQGDYVTLEANPDYFRGAPLTQNLMMRVIPEAAQRTIALETGEIDIAYDIAPIDVAKVEENPELQLQNAPALGLTYLSFNMQKPNLDDQLVRQAIRYAINCEDLLAATRYGQGSLGNSIIPPAAFGFSDKAPDFSYDLEKAKALMAEAGKADGFPLTLYASDSTANLEVSQIIQSQLKELNIDVEIKIMEFGTYIELTSIGEHDMTLGGWTCSTSDADYNYNAMLHSVNQGLAGNRSFLDDPEVDRLIEEGRSTADPAARQAIYDELEQYVGPISPIGTLMYTNLNIGATAKMSGFSIDPNGYHRLFTVAVAE